MMKMSRPKYVIPQRRATTHNPPEKPPETNFPEKTWIQNNSSSIIETIGIGRLPTEVIVIIMSFMKVLDILTIRPTCKQFLNITSIINLKSVPSPLIPGSIMSLIVLETRPLSEKLYFSSSIVQRSLTIGAQKFSCQMFTNKPNDLLDCNSIVSMRVHQPSWLSDDEDEFVIYDCKRVKFLCLSNLNFGHSSMRCLKKIPDLKVLYLQKCILGTRQPYILRDKALSKEKLPKTCSSILDFTSKRLKSLETLYIDLEDCYRSGETLEIHLPTNLKYLHLNSGNSKLSEVKIWLENSSEFRGM